MEIEKGGVTIAALVLTEELTWVGSVILLVLLLNVVSRSRLDRPE